MLPSPNDVVHAYLNHHHSGAGAGAVSCLCKLNGKELIALIRYLLKWLTKYERFPQAGPCPEAAAVLGLTVCDWVPKLEDVVKFLGFVLDENFSSLVLHPEFHELLRLIEEVQYDIPVKSRVMVNVWAIGRDPQYWDDAESFIPERFEDSSLDFKGNNFEYLPFGAGRRICPGMNFGVAGLTLPLAMLMYHLNWELPHGMKTEDLDMTEVPGLTIARRIPLRVIPTVYDPSLLHDI
ncbi:hypothetical protein PIB30_065277 [Stylosanthes scabra]|uniref:Uncharacterized protein n=1 Tax=Stylosanthes scabra TaxID=79078 RepID=A0ABU6WNK3_9FABA|nr:hypothetical protein [Stylosanthes scabra]